MANMIYFIVILGYLSLNAYCVQAGIFSCDRTAACGCSLVDAEINARIVGGELAANHSWGWAVSLRYLDEAVCGGAILSKHYIITAAHCVFGSESSPEEFSVALGKNRLDAIEGQTYSPSKIYSHPNYDERSNQNDIAILELSTPINFTDPHVSKLCLPLVSEAEQTQYPFVHRPIVAIGWGTTSSRGNASLDLRQVTVNTLPSNHSSCQPVIRNPDIQFCAGVSGGDKGQWCSLHIVDRDYSFFYLRYLPRRLRWSYHVLLREGTTLVVGWYYLVWTWLWLAELCWCLYTSEQIHRMDQIHCRNGGYGDHSARSRQWHDWGKYRLWAIPINNPFFY